MGEPKRSLFARMKARIFPEVPDFYQILATQSANVSHSGALLVELLQSGDPALGAKLREYEHEQDTFKFQNLQLLNESFSTPMDREDIYRAIMILDEIVNYAKTTYYEMDVLGVKPDAFMQEIAALIKEGTDALAEGFSRLKEHPKEALSYAELARKSERKVEKVYRRALAALFQGDDYINMFKRREIYRHLSNAADRVSTAAITLNDIIVKSS